MGQWASKQSSRHKISGSEPKNISKLTSSESAYRSQRKVARLRSNSQAQASRKGQRKVKEVYGARYIKHMQNVSPDIAWKRERKLRNRKKVQDSLHFPNFL